MDNNRNDKGYTMNNRKDNIRNRTNRTTSNSLSRNQSSRRKVNSSTYWYRKDHNTQNQNMAGENDVFAMNNKNRHNNRPYNSNCLL